MAYATTNPPRLVTQSIAGRRTWEYEGTDTGAQAQVAGFITNGGELGMKVADLVRVLNTATNIQTTHTVISVSATAPGAVNLSDATVTSSGTNSD